MRQIDSLVIADDMGQYSRVVEFTQAGRFSIDKPIACCRTEAKMKTGRVSSAHDQTGVFGGEGESEPWRKVVRFDCSAASLDLRSERSGTEDLEGDLIG